MDQFDHFMILACLAIIAIAVAEWLFCRLLESFRVARQKVNRILKGVDR